MKCPKCDYLGFETGDRCKNCGYDFSQLNATPPEFGELTLKAEPPDTPLGDLWFDGSSMRAPGDGAAEQPAKIEASFPLFTPPGQDENAPLVKLPAEPRPPLAVRRAPDNARVRTSSRSPRRAEAGLTLSFADDPPAEPPPPSSVVATPVSAPRSAVVGTAVAVGPPLTGDEDLASLGARTMAAVVDHAILLSIDFVVIYSTLRMAGLTLDDWRALPALPLLAFLLLLKLTYFSAFTAMGGQTIGKMAAGIRVVADDHQPLDPARAIRRSLMGAVSLLSLGLGLIPALVSPDRRTFHDHVAHTQVVDVPSA